LAVGFPFTLCLIDSRFVPRGTEPIPSLGGFRRFCVRSDALLISDIH